MSTQRNWAGNLTYTGTIIAPSTIDEVRSIVRASPKVRALGSRHSFSDIVSVGTDGEPGTIVDVTALTPHIEINPLTVVDHDVDLDPATGSGSVSVSAGVRYGDLAAELHAHGRALGAMASLPHISVGGAVATATHGSGDTSTNLATAVREIDLVTSDGELITLRRGDEHFAGAVVGLGALGIVTRLTLDTEPAYDIAQTVYDNLPLETALANLDAVTSAGQSVSLFSSLTNPEVIDQVWVKRRASDEQLGEQPGEQLGDLLGAAAAPHPLHPVRGMPAENTTTQGGISGPWHERLPHFKLAFTPSAGEELQSEYIVDRVHAVDAIRSIHALADRIAPHLLAHEIRTVAADDLWLSTAYGADALCLHFTFTPEPEAVMPLLEQIEAALEPYAPRPHWGKLFTLGADTIVPRYARMGDFHALAHKLDERGAFRNAYTERVIGLGA